MRQLSLALVLLGCSWLAMSAPQDPKIDMQHDVQPLSVQAQLAKRGIGSDQPSLLRALKNSDPEVRWLAAIQLRDNALAPMASNAIPALVEGLREESEQLPAAGMAATLGALGDPRGVAALERMCFDPGVRTRVKKQVALDMIALKSERCVDPILDLAFPKGDKDGWLVTEEVISLLPQFQQHLRLTAKQNERIVEIVRRGLADPIASLRLSAAAARSWMVDSSARDDLLKAMAVEVNLDIWNSMRHSLEGLEKRLPR